MDYRKFCFDQKKREKEAKKNQRVVEIKEIRMSPGIDTNDLNTKVKNAMKFLNDGNRVKVFCAVPGQRNGPYQHRRKAADGFCRRLW